MTVRIASRVIVNAGARMLSTEEVTAIATEAHRLGRTVAAHATTESAARIAAEAGADSIEHGYRLPDDVLAVMARKGIWTNARRGQVWASVETLFATARP